MNKASVQAEGIWRWVIGSNPARTVLRAVIWGVLAFIVVRFAAQPVMVRGRSMEPTIQDGSLRIINLLAFRLREPRRHDVVAIRMLGSRTYYLKRILGIPGDTVAFENGTLILNGAAVSEPFARGPCAWSMGPVRLGDEEYFVAGDNRTGPMETHLAGVVRRERIAGGLWF